MFSAKPQHLPKGTASSSESSGQGQAFADRPEGSCSAAEGEGSKARSRQPAEKYAYERQTRKQAEKAPLPASAPLPSACTAAQRGSSPRRLRAPLCASQPLLPGSPPPEKPAPGAMALRKLAFGTGTTECWLGAQAGLGPAAPSPLLSLPFPPWLWALSIANRLGFRRLLTLS